MPPEATSRCGTDETGAGRMRRRGSTSIDSRRVVSIGSALAIVGMAIKARGRRVVSGAEQMVGAEGEALEDLDATGWVRVHGENWKAVTKSPIRQGQKVQVTGIRGLELSVEAFEDPQNGGVDHG